MSDRYGGSDFKTIYAIDPISSKEIKGLDIDLALTKADIQDVYDYKFKSAGREQSYSSRQVLLSGRRPRSASIISDPAAKSRARAWLA